jgi:predicted DNA-binding ribbon-helix-helix protein
MTLSELVGEIDGQRKQGNLSSAIRLFVLDHYRSMTLGPSEPNGANESARDSMMDSQAAE